MRSISFDQNAGKSPFPQKDFKIFEANMFQVTLFVLSNKSFIFLWICSLPVLKVPGAKGAAFRLGS